MGDVTPFRKPTRPEARGEEAVELHQPFDQVELASGMQVYMLDHVHAQGAFLKVSGGACWADHLRDPVKAAAHLRENPGEEVYVINPHGRHFAEATLLAAPPEHWCEHVRVGYLHRDGNGFTLVYFFVPVSNIIDAYAADILLIPSGDDATMHVREGAPWDVRNVYYNCDYADARYLICLDGDGIAVEVLDKPRPGWLTVLFETEGYNVIALIGFEYLSRIDLDTEDAKE